MSERIDVEAGFSDWRQAFLDRAIQSGIDPEIVQTCAKQLILEPKILAAQSGQAEFTLTITDYLDRVVTEQRERKGRSAFRNKRQMLSEIASDYQVDAQVILAIWGIESNYGKTCGNWPVLSALATLAFAGHRSDFFETELIAALHIIEKGDVHPSNFRGSWAGAMGHGQFMPSSFQAYAVDHDKDGRRDIWGNDPVDGLASIANYLKHHGWISSRPALTEITLPTGFDFALAGRHHKLPVDMWASVGIRSAENAPIPDYGESSVLLPAGARGPAFMVFDNFDVILTYNRAEAYGIAVGHLANRLEGGRPIRTRCPEDLVALTRDGMREVQTLLTQAGFDTFGADGFSGPNTTKALRAYQKAQGLVADGYASGEVLDHLRAQAG